MDQQAPEAMGLRERVAYLTGLARAQGPGGEQVVAGMLTLLGDMAREVDQLRAADRELAGRVRALRGHLAELADEVFGEGTALLHCGACGQAMRVLTADLQDDQVELVCPNCGRVVHAYDPGLDYDEDEDSLRDAAEPAGPPGPISEDG